MPLISSNVNMSILNRLDTKDERFVNYYWEQLAQSKLSIQGNSQDSIHKKLSIIKNTININSPNSVAIK